MTRQMEPPQTAEQDTPLHEIGKPDAAHFEEPVDIHGLVVDRRHEQELLAARLEGEDKKIKRIVRRLDLRLVLMLALLYVWAFIDRGNLGNVRMAAQIAPCWLNSELTVLPGQYRGHER